MTNPIWENPLWYPRKKATHQCCPEICQYLSLLDSINKMNFVHEVDCVLDDDGIQWVKNLKVSAEKTHFVG